MPNSIRISLRDNVAVALGNISAGTQVDVADEPVTVFEDIPQGHKLALCDIAAGSPVIKYGFTIGTAKCDISRGSWVHTHNVRTNLSEGGSYVYRPKSYPQPEHRELTFDGFLREDGRAGVRNEIWIIPTVGCVNNIARALAEKNRELCSGNLEGIYAFSHPYGCSQIGDDHAQTRKLLAALCRHPNAAGVLVLSLGCENNTIDGFKEELSKWDDRRVKFLVCQESDDELAEGARLLSELAEYAKSFKRQKLPADKLVVGMKCGGSDGLSGITANPAVGAFSDLILSAGGTTILTEVPEMFGAEQVLLDRCKNSEIFDEAVGMINGFKQYFVSHGQVVYENPSPGNKQGGITTLEDKSLGCVQKGGTAPVTGVMGYGDAVKKRGLNLLYGPGNDIVSTTALTAAGAHIILFTTGRGTPLGAPAPTVKIATNSALYRAKSGWMDFNAGPIADGESVSSAGERLLQFVLEIASGKLTMSEEHGYREIAIFKDGVTM